MRVTIDPVLVAKSFEAHETNPSLQESAQLHPKGEPILEMIPAMAMSPGVLRAFAGLDSVYPHGALERSVTEKIILTVSQLHACQFCTESHVDMMTGLGIAPDVSPSAAHTERERLAIEYATAITNDSNRVPDALFDRLRAVYTDAEIVELTFMTGLITMLNRFNNALGVRYAGQIKTVTVAR